MQSRSSFSTSRFPAIVAACAFAIFSGCEQKVAQADPEKERQLQAMQEKMDALSAQSAQLAQQLADREAADTAAKRSALEDEKEELNRQRAELEKNREALAVAPVALANTPAPEPRNETVTEPVYNGKTADYGLFYTKLQDDGDWIESEEYGYIWHPNVARNSSWRPYSDGRWVQTERGWTWDSRERFGWATYHYGRWVDLNNSGWCWVPGNEWAPAWVSWRSGDRHVGWAPLPPEARLREGGRFGASIDDEFDNGPGVYNFVSTEDFGEETYVGRLVEPAQNVTLVQETVNVTNISYNNRVVYNYGPDYESLQRGSRRPVNRYRLDLQRGSDFNREESVPRPRGDRLAVVAPVFAQAGNSDVRPVNIRKKIVRADRERGWRDIQPEQRQSVKQALAASQVRPSQQIREQARPVQSAPSVQPVQPVQREQRPGSREQRVGQNRQETTRPITPASKPVESRRPGTPATREVAAETPNAVAPTPRQNRQAVAPNSRPRENPGQPAGSEGAPDSPRQPSRTTPANRGPGNSREPASREPANGQPENLTAQKQAAQVARQQQLARARAQAELQREKAAGNAAPPPAAVRPTVRSEQPRQPERVAPQVVREPQQSRSTTVSGENSAPLPVAPQRGRKNAPVPEADQGETPKEERKPRR